MEDAREATGRRRLGRRVEEDVHDPLVERATVADLDGEEERGLALVDAFDSGRSFYLAVMGEEASDHYTSEFVAKLFEAEGRGAFSVRQAVVGHVQQGGVPTPFDRINATRLAYQAIYRRDVRPDVLGDLVVQDEYLGWIPDRLQEE